MEKTTILDGKLYTVATLIGLIILVQFLWIGFTIIGLGVFGYYPATIAAYKTLNKFKSGDEQYKNIPKYFYNSYSQHFKSGNIIGVANLIIVYMLITNIRITSAVAFNWNAIVFILFLMLLCLFFVIQPYLLMIMAVSKDSMKRNISCAVLLAVSSPLSSLVFFIMFAIYAMGIWLVPSVYMLFGATLPLLLLTYWAQPKVQLLTLQVEESVQ